MFWEKYIKKMKQSNLEIEIISTFEEENDTEQKIATESNEENTEEMSKMLMVYVGEAIEKWAQQYDMQRLPKNIVFKKALTLMNAWEKIEIFK